MSNNHTTQNSFAISQEDIREVAEQIVQKFRPHKIILFGSHARGESHTHSDVDLLIILEDGRKDIDWEIEVNLSVPHKFPMDILVRTPQKLAERLKMGDPFMHDIIENGQVLYERPG